MRGGALAQLVEQWTENPCVPGSIPGGTTVEPTTFYGCGFFILYKSSPKQFDFTPFASTSKTHSHRHLLKLFT